MADQVLSFEARKQRADTERAALEKRAKLDRRKFVRRTERSVINILEWALADAYAGKLRSVAIAGVYKKGNTVLCSWSTTRLEHALAQYGAMHKVADEMFHEMSC